MDIKLQQTARLVILSSLLLVGISAQPASTSGAPAGASAQVNDPIIERLLKDIDELEVVQKRMQEKLDSLTAPAVAAPPALPAAVDPAPSVQELAAADPTSGESHAL